MEPILVLLTWAMALACVIALGSVVARWTGLEGPSFLRGSIWSGLALLAALSLLLNIWLPLRSGWTSLSIAGLSLLAGAIGLRRMLANRERWRSPERVHAVLAVLAVLTAVGLAIGSTLAPTNYDSGLYHLAAVRFAMDYPTIPGLANLNAPLGYSTPQFPLAAVLGLGPLGERGYAALNGLLVVALIVDLLLRSVARRRRSGYAVSIILTSLVAGIALAFADWLVASPTSDTAVLVLVAAAVVAYADALTGPRVSRIDVVAIGAPLLLATSMRLQTAAFAAVVVLGTVWFARRHGAARGALRALVTTVSVGVLLAAAVVARDLLLSGRVGFPLSLWTASVPWFTPDAAALRDATIAIARDPGPGYMQTLGTFTWVPAWAVRQSTAWETLLLAVLCLSAAVLCGISMLQHQSIRWRALALLIAPGLAYSILWVLVLPPTWRLAWGPILGTAAAACGWLVHRRGWAVDRLALAALGLTTTLGIACVVARYPGKPDAIPTPSVREVTLPSGLRVTQPDSGDQCWLAQPPLCTPSPAPGLALRGTEIRDGFVSAVPSSP